MSLPAADAFLCVCLNPVIQKTLVFPRLVPGEVNRSAEHRVDASGKGLNVARVLAQSGRRAIHLTQAGGRNRDWFLALCAEDGVELRTVDSGSEIRFCYTVIDRESGNATELVEEAAPVGPATGKAVLEAFEAALPEARAVILSGTKAAGFGPELLPEIARKTREAGRLLVLDIKGADLLACLPAGPLVVKPNLQEFLATWPCPAGSTGAEAVRDHAGRVARDLFERHGSHLVLTRGSQPTWYWDGSGLAELGFQALKALNPTGSGDAFTAGLSAVLAEGLAADRPEGAPLAAILAAAVAEGSRLGGLNALNLRPGSIL